MAKFVENIELDDTNIEFNYAFDFVKNTNKLVYLTGKAGTGKTTFLKYLRENISKNTVILAPTGVAAINAGGQTINSFFQIAPSVYIPNDKRLRTVSGKKDSDKSTIWDNFKYFKEKVDIIKTLELLIIDEVSMVRCDLLDVIDSILRVFRENEKEAFGGVQVVLIGDTFQLPPVADFEQWTILQKYYSTPFFFSSKVIEKNKPVYIELKKIYRQNEKEFIELLNKVRINQITDNEIDLLNSKYNPNFIPHQNANYITLATHNRMVEATNLNKLNELIGDLKSFEGIISGLFPENIMPTDKILRLKVGAQIMFIKNDKSKRYYNGKIAKINRIDENSIVAEFSDGQEITVNRQIWNNIKYKLNERKKRIEEEVVGTFEQFPIKLAWAITVHKSQGLTFEKVIADLGSAFAPGQVYVALSRCTSFNGLILKSKIQRSAIITDPNVLLFAQCETPRTLVIDELNSGKANKYYRNARENINEFNFSMAFENLVKAISYRNDFETPIFKKYFTVKADWLSSYRKKYFDTLNRLNKKTKENVALNKELLNLIKFKEEHQEKINNQNRAIKILLDKSIDVDKQIENLHKEISRLSASKMSMETNLKQCQNQINRYEEEISTLQNKCHEYELEIGKIKALKWHQRLFLRKSKIE